MSLEWKQYEEFVGRAQSVGITDALNTKSKTSRDRIDIFTAGKYLKSNQKTLSEIRKVAQISCG